MLSSSAKRVLLIGSGGREHALAWKISQSPGVEAVWCYPGNPGIDEEPKSSVRKAMGPNNELDVLDHAAVIDFCLETEIDLVVIGPEIPLAAGLVDDLTEAGIMAFGPTKKAAQLESSKGFTKDLCYVNDIPTAAYQRFSDPVSAADYVREHGAPIVVKADGLASGKGVTVAMTEEEAIEAVNLVFGPAKEGASVVIEDFLEGEEASFFVLCDGEHAVPLTSAQDHKRAFDGDKGPNTGGMGAYSPAAVMTDEMCSRVIEEIVRPTLRAMRAMKMPFKGVLFAGLMITDTGPKLIEYNVRFGDPETQVLMKRLKSDIVPLLTATCRGTLESLPPVEWDPDPALVVVMAAKGYPGRHPTGSPIDGVAEAESVEGVKVFQAGTQLAVGRGLVSAGGRVLGVTASGETVAEAQKRAYQAVGLIQLADGFCRRDIGWRAIARDTTTA